MSKSEVLDMEIRALVAELIESAPPAPSLPELDRALRYLRRQAIGNTFARRRDLG